MTTNITMIQITASKQNKTIIHISYFQLVNILARKIKGETFILNRPLERQVIHHKHSVKMHKHFFKLFACFYVRNFHTNRPLGDHF